MLDLQFFHSLGSFKEKSDISGASGFDSGLIPISAGKESWRGLESVLIQRETTHHEHERVVFTNSCRFRLEERCFSRRFH